MKIFVADSVADETREFEIDDHRLAGLPLRQQCLMADAFLTHMIDATAIIRHNKSVRYEEHDGIGMLFGGTDGRNHGYGVVLALPGVKKVRLAARQLLLRLNRGDY